MSDTETRLTKVRNAIDAILAGSQSYAVDGVSYSRANLASLTALEERYEKKLEKEQSRTVRVSRCRFPSEG